MLTWDIHMEHKNWAGNIVYSISNLHEPQRVEKIQELVRQSKQVRVLGSRHSFNTIADSSDILISLKKVNPVLELNREKQTVTIEAGMRYGELASYLHGEGFALHNLASLPHISVIGACATATHGSGVRNGNLATAVSGIEFISGDGSIISLSRTDGDIFKGAVVNLGAWGIVTKLTLDIEPTYDIRQNIFLDLPLTQLEQHFEEIMSSAYSVSLFTHWQNDVINQVWLKSRENEEIPSDIYGASPATHNYHPIADVDPENCTQQMNIRGAWHERLPHFRMEFTPSKGDELQSEYFIPREHAVDAIQKLFEIGDSLDSLLLVSEIRCIASDDLWLSPCYQQDCVAFHFTWKQDWRVIQEALPEIEKVLAPFNPIPHWGKLFTMSPETIQSRYQKLPEFIELTQKYDPDGKFRNEFVDKYLFS